MRGLHPEIGRYWRRVCTSAEQTYEQYLKDLSYSKVSILPTELVARTPIEERIESRLKMMLKILYLSQLSGNVMIAKMYHVHKFCIEQLFSRDQRARMII